MRFEERRYVFLEVSEISKIAFGEVLETSENTLRINADGTKTFVKYENEMPASVTLLQTKSVEYTHDEILVVLNTDEWQVYDEIDLVSNNE
jgi:hypothetical protein